MENTRLVYKIESVRDREGNKKEIPAEWRGKSYSLDAVVIGRRAYLGWIDESNGLDTSGVEDIMIWGNTVKITTRNTVYWMKPVIEGA